MLVLSRRVGERVVIGDGITVTVTRVAGQRVMLGIEAPEGVRILRGELSRRSSEVRDAPSAAPQAPLQFVPVTDVGAGTDDDGSPVEVARDGAGPLVLALTP